MPYQGTLVSSKHFLVDSFPIWRIASVSSSLRKRLVDQIQALKENTVFWLNKTIPCALLLCHFPVVCRYPSLITRVLSKDILIVSRCMNSRYANICTAPFDGFFYKRNRYNISTNSSFLTTLSSEVIELSDLLTVFRQVTASETVWLIINLLFFSNSNYSLCPNLIFVLFNNSESWRDLKNSDAWSDFVAPFLPQR